MRHQVAIGDQHARSGRVGADDTDGLAGLDEQGVVLVEFKQDFNDFSKRLLISGSLSVPAINNELLRVFRHFGIEVVQQHAQRGLGLPAFGMQLRAGGRFIVGVIGVGIQKIGNVHNKGGFFK